MHFDDIKLNGYGYKLQCNILRDYFTKNNELQVGELINIANGTEEGIKILKKNFIQKEIPIQKQKEIFELMKTTIK